MGLIFWFIAIRPYKHTFILRDQTANGSIVQRLKVQEYKDKDGVIWWRPILSRQKFKVPPKDAIDIDAKGRKFAEAFKNSDGNIVHIRVHSDTKDHFVNCLDSDDKIQTLNELRKAHSHKKKSLSELVMTLAPLASLTILVICLMVFWGEIAKPAIQAQEIQNSYAEIQKETLQIIKDIKTDTQTIKDRDTPSQGAPR